MINKSLKCPDCGVVASFSPLKVRVNREESKRGLDSQLTERHFGQALYQGVGNFWWMAVCPACGIPCLIRGHGDDVYPKALPDKSDERIPLNIRNDLDEAKLCHSVGCFKASAIMSRRVIQQTCSDKEAEGKDLRAQIESLFNVGTITNDVRKWATAVRLIGNDGAHPNRNDVSFEESSDGLGLAEQFVHIIYVTPAIAEARLNARQ